MQQHVVVLASTSGCFVRSTELCFLARHALFAERSETKNHKNLNNSIWSTMGSKPSTSTCFSHNLERFGKREKNSVKRKKRYPLPKFCTHTHTLSWAPTTQWQIDLERCAWAPWRDRYVLHVLGFSNEMAESVLLDFEQLKKTWTQTTGIQVLISLLDSLCAR